MICAGDDLAELVGLGGFYGVMMMHVLGVWGSLRKYYVSVLMISLSMSVHSDLSRAKLR